jgi:predicted RNA-binding Zn ribbon-like protein
MQRRSNIMKTIYEEQSKVAPGELAVIQDFLNTQYGQARHAHVELANPEQLRTWLVARSLLANDIAITEGDFRRVIQLREALRVFLHTNNSFEASTVPDEILNNLASNAPLTVHFRPDELPVLEPDIAGIDGMIARLVGIVFTSMIDGTWARLKVCRNERCQKAFYDISKNHSGVWCSMTVCGSRFKAQVYRQRRITQVEG